MHRQSDRAFGLTFALLFSLISVVGMVIFEANMHWTIGIALAFLLIALALPAVLLPLNRLWGLLALRLASVNNHLVLGIFFYLIIVPAGFLMRRLGGDPMCRAFDPGAESYWQPVTRQSNAETLPDLF